MSVVLQKNCEYFLLEICKPLQCKASEAKISGLKPPDIETLEPQRFEGFKLFIEFVGKTLFPTILPTNLLLGIVKSFVFVTWQ